LLVLLLSAAIAAVPPASVITPAAVARMIHQLGPRGTVDKLAGDKGADLGEYEEVLDGIASGDARWLALVPKLQPGTDAGTSEALRIAVAEALPKTPTGVLRLIARIPAWAEACSYPMIEPTHEQARAYFKAAIPAVTRVRIVALQRARNICLTELRRAQHSS